MADIPYMVKLAIIVAAVLAIAYIAMKAMGVNPPPWLMQMFWVVVVAFVAIFAIGLLMRM